MPSVNDVHWAGRDARLEVIANKKVIVCGKHVPGRLTAERIAASRSKADSDEAFMVVDLDHIVERYRLWRKLLPRVEPYYAIKANNDSVVVNILAALGAGFDCASKGEIQQALSHECVSADRIVFANTIKIRDHVLFASENNIRRMTFDNAEELRKIATYHTNPEYGKKAQNVIECRPILRIDVQDAKAAFPTSIKFGAEPVETAPKLLELAVSLGLNVRGIAFHVGSACHDANAFEMALRHARRLFDVGTALGHRMDLIDVGGGFPGSEFLGGDFYEMAEAIGRVLDELFPKNVQCIAEPGRFFPESAFTLVCNVIGKTEVAASKITKNEADAHETGFMYYLNDGIYGTFNYILLKRDDEEEFSSVLWGPTSDWIDKVASNVKLPRLNIGDWLLFPFSGAYTTGLSTNFHNLPHPSVYYTISADNWKLVRDRL